MLSDIRSALEVNRLGNDPDFMTSLARGLFVLAAFSDRKRPMRIAELARITELDRAVVRRCLHTLVQIGMVEKFDKTYRLTSGVLNLGHAYFSSSHIVEKSHVYLEKLSASVFTNCSLAIMEAREVVYLSRVQSRKLIEKPIGLGSRLPAHCTSVGRVLLSNLPDAELRLYFDSVRLEPYTEFTVTDKDQLFHMLQQIRIDGYATVDQEYELGLTAIAIPVRVRGIQTPMALSITANAKYVPAEQLVELYLEKMQGAAKQLYLIGDPHPKPKGKPLKSGPGATSSD